jgi:hypothetical protein
MLYSGYDTWTNNLSMSMMEPVSTSETSANYYKITRRNTQEESYLHTRRHENLKSHVLG